MNKFRMLKIFIVTIFFILSTLGSIFANASSQSSSRNASKNGVACDSSQSGKAASGNSRAQSCTYTVSFHPNGGSVSPSSAEFKIGGSPITLPTPVKASFNFNGWFSSLSGGTAIPSPYVPTSSTTLYAQWTPIDVANRGDGLSPATAGSSAWQIKRDFSLSSDGLYWIKNQSINGGAPFQIYADMTTEGGGWTLIVANATFPWTNDEAKLINANNPPVDPTTLTSQNGKYSILTYADYLKKSPSGFQYRIDAGTPRSCGGIWTANSDYSFISTSALNTAITVNVNWSGWDVNRDETFIHKRMPYLSALPESGLPESGLLTTSDSPSGFWWGTLIQSSNWGSTTTPWIFTLDECQVPAKIWYWVR